MKKLDPDLALLHVHKYIKPALPGIASGSVLSLYMLTFIQRLFILSGIYVLDIEFVRTTF